MSRQHRALTRTCRAAFIALALTTLRPALAQLPTVDPAAVVDTHEAAKPKPGVATTTGAIVVEKRVDDRTVREVLLELLHKYPGVRDAEVIDEDGIVTINGHVEDEETLDEVTDFVRRVEGVRLVLNRMKTDAEVLTAHQMAAKVLGEFRDLIARKWVLAILSVVTILASLGLARLFARYHEALLSVFVKNILLRSIAGSVLTTLIVIAGVMTALSLLNLTHAVLSNLGLAGVVGLALGFAFRDIAENFIASILLGVRRPFRIGDYVEVAGKAGFVKTLNTRATVLVTLEGNHVRIPNATIFKEILVNTTASQSVRRSFDVLIPYEVSTATAIEAITGALRGQEGVLAEPPAHVLVEGLEPEGVRLRAHYWMPTRGVDEFMLLSDVRLRTKVALQRVGITPPPLTATITVAGANLGGLATPHAHGPHLPGLRYGSLMTAEQARANLLNDTQAAAEASTLPREGRETAMDHALQDVENGLADEGTNLLKGD